MKPCVLLDDKVVIETAGGCKERCEIKTAMIDVRKPRGLSFDGKRSRDMSAGTINDRINSNPSPCEDKRTNSDDESESKVSSYSRDQAADVTVTKGLDALAAIASEAQSIPQEDMQKELAPQISQSKSPHGDVKRADEADNSEVGPSAKSLNIKKTHIDAAALRHPSRQTQIDMHSPPFDRYGPPPHYMHAPPPGYCPPPNPYYSYGHYLSSPPRIPPPSPYYQGHYYPPHPHTYGSVHPAYPHPSDVKRYRDKIPSVPILPPREENAPSPPANKKRPSQEELPLKKRKFQAVDSKEAVTDDEADGSKVDLCNEDKESKSNGVKFEANEAYEVNIAEKKAIGSEPPKKITRNTSEVVTPSPRSELKSANSSPGSVSAQDPAAAKSEASKMCSESKDAPFVKVNGPDMQSSSSLAVPPHLPRPYRPGYPPAGQHYYGPHYLSPLRAAQLKHREQGLVSPPHYPYPSRHGPHPYHHLYYYPPSHPHEATPYWHRHTHPYAPTHRSHHDGSSESVPNHVPVHVVSSANADSLDNKAVCVSKGQADSPGKKKDARLSQELNGQVAIAGESNGRRCAHIFGAMLVHFVGKRGVPENDAASLPSFYKLVNYPEFLPQKNNHFDGNTLSDDETKQKNNPITKYCVMCGTCCYFVGMSKNKTEQTPAIPSHCVIPRQNKGLCTACDVKIWLYRDLNITIKWCKGCKNFRTWSAFGEKSRATKCSKCRDRQKEKYAAQKEALKKKGESDKEKERGSDSDESDGRREGKASDDEMDAASGLCNMVNGCV